MIEVSSVDPSMVAEASRTLAAAFGDDPVFTYMARDRAGMHTRLTHGFAGMIRAELGRTEPLTFITADGGCAAIWHPVDGWKASVLETLRVAPAFVRSFGPRVDRLVRVQQALERAHPAEPHYHLAFIGTRPPQQGKGLGGEVMSVMTERCDREGLPAYLESSNPLNESLYVRHGFVATGRIPLPKGAPPVTAMWREPR